MSRNGLRPAVGRCWPRPYGFRKLVVYRRLISLSAGFVALVVASTRGSASTLFVRVRSEARAILGRGDRPDPVGNFANTCVRSHAERARPCARATAEQVEIPLDQLVENDGEYFADVAPEKLDPIRAYFPSLDMHAPGLRVLSPDPPVLVLEGLLNDTECEAFVESMRGKDGQFPERLGQSDLPAIPSFLNPVKNLMKGVPVLDWLGNPTVRWTYRSRNLLDKLLKKVRQMYSLDLEQGAANIKHYRKDQWLPVHIDYNKATMMVYLADVEEGGHTMFPTLGFKVRPEKGSALVWANQPPLKHAGDRVVEGEKWILFYNWPAEQNWEYDDNFEFNE